MSEKEINLVENMVPNRLLFEGSWYICQPTTLWESPEIRSENPLDYSSVFSLTAYTMRKYSKNGKSLS